MGGLANNLNRLVLKQRKERILIVQILFSPVLEALYNMNILLLSTSIRVNNGWNESGEALKSFQKHRPDEDSLDSFFDELKLYWDALIEELPQLRNNPIEMRDHSVANVENAKTSDSLLFWPIGQELLAEIARTLLDFRQENVAEPSTESVRNALSGLNNLIWDLNKAPWRHLFSYQLKSGFDYMAYSK